MELTCLVRAISFSFGNIHSILSPSSLFSLICIHSVNLSLIRKRSRVAFPYYIKWYTTSTHSKHDPPSLAINQFSVPSHHTGQILTRARGNRELHKEICILNHHSLPFSFSSGLQFSYTFHPHTHQ